MSDDILQVMDVGLRPYGPVMALQDQLVAERFRDAIPDTLILVEHEPVYTLGRRAPEAHIVATAGERNRMGIDVVHTTRGGDVTYHGPGQLVGYPIVHLGHRGAGAVWYVGRIEQVLIDTLATFGVAAGLDAVNRGVWVGREKIAAIGVRISRQITQHGFALNVRPDMSHYAGIVPCGLHERGVTSLHKLGKGVPMADVKKEIIHHFQRVFGYGEWRSVAAPGLAEPVTENKESA